MTIRIKRIYDMPSEGDGKRVLIDRIWTRGISKAIAQLDMWLKEVAPSTELRSWYVHSPKKQEEFRNLYEQELSPDSKIIYAVKLLKKMAVFKHPTVTATP
ncbi:DUF488 family protein [Clostridium estertheticum]|uniref:DUF488 family protein n=1 Tax=Clostridium estertheticum TaxID=238834 RepID=A0A5N7J1P3_9CLOT|nr:DUF488 family protein [Clostridium estertheticum]MPQ31944.1 DUF488 family protein [Clostridium estertheticum]MPQ62603.1 DUF488 family protein [Clostridium estertheticum]